MYRGRPPTDVAPLAVAGPWATALVVHPAAQTNLQLTTPLLWTVIAISVAGAIVTFAFLVYAVLRFRDPAVRRRRYG
jgi:hypothetical protein